MKSSFLFCSCLPNVINIWVTTNAIQRGFAINRVIDENFRYYPVFNRMMNTILWKLTAEENKKVSNFELIKDLFSELRTNDIIIKYFHNSLFIPIDKD